MIGSIRGEIIEKGENHLLVDVNGVGFLVYAPTSLLDRLDGGLVTLYTHLHVRENELTLYGFGEREELELFRTLLGVQGIGGDLAPAHLDGPQQRDHHADLVGALLLLAALYGEGADFFWV